MFIIMNSNDGWHVEYDITHRVGSNVASIPDAMKIEITDEYLPYIDVASYRAFHGSFPWEDGGPVAFKTFIETWRTGD